MIKLSKALIYYASIYDVQNGIIKREKCFYDNALISLMYFRVKFNFLRSHRIHYKNL